MSSMPENLPPDYPEYLRHTDADTPDPTWEQITRGGDAEMVAHICRIMGNTENQKDTQDWWSKWPVSYRRTVGLLIDKIYNEGWLDVVGPINDGTPWDGGFYFWPLASDRGTLADVLDSKSGKQRSLHSMRSEQRVVRLHQCLESQRLASRLDGEQHRHGCAARRGTRENGSAEVHLEVFNSLYTKGAPRKDVTRIPFSAHTITSCFRCTAAGSSPSTSNTCARRPIFIT